MKFAELQPGRILEAGPYRVGQQEMLDFARSYDPQWFHTDVRRAQTGPYGGLIGSGWLTCGIVMRLVADAVLHNSESFGSPGLESLRWPHPVRPGDDLWLRAEVLENRRSARRPGLGLLRWRWQLFNTDRAEVLDLVATSMFDLAGETGAP